MKTMTTRFLTTITCAALIIICTAALQANTYNDDSIVGTVEKIDTKGKQIYVKSKDGVVKAYKWTSKSSVHGIKKAQIWTNHTAHLGAHVVIHTVRVGSEDTIQGLEWFGHGTVKVFKGTVKYLGSNGRKIEHIAEDGSVEVYDVSKHALVKTGGKIGHGAKSAAKATADGSATTFHVIEQKGKKFIHFIEHGN